MAAILDEGTEARKKSMQLNGIQYATELASELVSHAKSMETWYNVFQKALKAQPQKGDETGLRRCSQKSPRNRSGIRRPRRGLASISECFELTSKTIQINPNQLRPHCRCRATSLATACQESADGFLKPKKAKGKGKGKGKKGAVKK